MHCGNLVPLPHERRRADQVPCVGGVGSDKRWPTEVTKWLRVLNSPQLSLGGEEHLAEQKKFKRLAAGLPASFEDQWPTPAPIPSIVTPSQAPPPTPPPSPPPERRIDITDKPDDEGRQILGAVLKLTRPQRLRPKVRWVQADCVWWHAQQLCRGTWRSGVEQRRGLVFESDPSSPVSSPVSSLLLFSSPISMRRSGGILPHPTHLSLPLPSSFHTPQSCCYCNFLKRNTKPVNSVHSIAGQVICRCNAGQCYGICYVRLASWLVYSEKSYIAHVSSPVLLQTKGRGHISG